MEVPMSESKDVVLPSDSEKLSHKYILDTFKRKVFSEPEPQNAPVAEEPSPQPVAASPQTEASCGTEAPVEVGPPPAEMPGLELPPGQKYFRVNEVASHIGVESHVLRYWQSEFSTVRPRKSSNGHWVYSRRDVEAFHLIRHLLYVEKYSVEGARKRLKQEKKAAAPSLPSPLQTETLKNVARELKELIHLARNAHI
jgi:DNA-binding transcriptional MerR regulator